MKVLVKATVSEFTGYGRDTIGLVEALMRANVDVYLDPTYLSPPLSQDIANLLTKRLIAPFDLLLHHVDPGALTLEQHTVRAADMRVAWTMWERSSFDNLNNKQTLRKRLNGVYDVLLSYDQVTKTAFEPYARKTRSYVAPPTLGILQGGYAPEGWAFAERDWATPNFNFCMLGQLHDRKDPWVAIEAFRELKEEHPDFATAGLELKTNIATLHPGLEELIPGLKIHYDVWTTEQVKDFYGRMHCLLAPSRGEGKNLPALEFMSTGGAVIATNWGGHTGWLNSEYSYPLNYTLAPAEKKFPECKDARADKEHLKELMLHVFRDRADARRKGQVASEVIPKMMSWDTVVKDLFLRLKDLNPEKGRKLHEQFVSLSESDSRD